MSQIFGCIVGVFRVVSNPVHANMAAPTATAAPAADAAKKKINVDVDSVIERLLAVSHWWCRAFIKFIGFRMCAYVHFFVIACVVA